MQSNDLTEDDLQAHLTLIRAKGSAKDKVSSEGSDLWQRRICILLLIAIITWCFIALVATLVAVWITKSPLISSIFLPLLSPVYLFNQILCPLLPMNEQRFLLALLRPKKVLLGKRERINTKDIVSPHGEDNKL